MAATFSYAQAAKGVASTQPSKTPSESTTPVPKSDEQTSDSVQPSEDVAAPKAEVAAEAETSVTENEVNSTKAEASESTTPSAGTVQTPTKSKEDEDSNTPNGTTESTGENQSQTSTSEKQSAPAEGTEGKTSEKKSKKEKPAPPKELKAAPLPAVNIWQQRKEAQDAKVKTTPAPAVGKKPTSETSSVSEDNQDHSKAGSKKKGGDASDKKKGDGVKGQETVPVPPVADATMWPTPEGAKGEEKKKAQEKSEKTDKSPVIRPHGKEKWTPVPYVPTAVFNTPLPSAARRGGRSARGGRDTARNGTHGSASEKTSPGQSTQGSTAKQASSGERGRNEPNAARANSLPAPSRRSNSADNAPADARKSQAADRSRGANNANATGKQVNGDSIPRNAKPFKNNEGYKGGEFVPKNAPLSLDTSNGPRSGSNNERRFENGPKSADFSSFHSDRKDKEFTPRGERGRGGHRGRGGGHAGYNGTQASHFTNNHMPPQNYMHPKSFGYNDRRGPQQHNMANGSRGHAMTMRSPSLPNSASMYNMYTPFPGDMNGVYGYQMPVGPMSANPYSQQPYVDQWPVMSMITMQLEYYFSVDNLCKDLYLRRHMDSQGFVPLNFIAGFKRVKQLSEDFELLRHVSRQLRSAEYLQGEDGIDRLRPRDKWEQWVVPMDQRDISAQNDGPSSSAAQTDAAPQKHLDGSSNGFVPSSSLVNGTVPLKTSLSSAAPEFSPSNGVHTGNEVSN